MTSYRRTNSGTGVKEQFQNFVANQDVSITSRLFYYIQQGVGDDLWYSQTLWSFEVTSRRHRSPLLGSTSGPMLLEGLTESCGAQN